MLPGKGPCQSPHDATLPLTGPGSGAAEASSQAFAILWLDREPLNIKYIHRCFSSYFRLLATTSFEQTLEWLSSKGGEIAIAILDQDIMNEEHHRQLQAVRERFPHIIFLVTTASVCSRTTADLLARKEYQTCEEKVWDMAQLATNLRSTMDGWLARVREH